MTTRASFIQAHNDRYRDAEALLKAKRWGGAIYLGGYVIECILKAKILMNLGSKNLHKDYWHHDLGKLVQSAGVERRLAEPQNREIRSRMRLIQLSWEVTMRYGSLQLIDRHQPLLFMRAVEEVKKWVYETI